MLNIAWLFLLFGVILITFAVVVEIALVWNERIKKRKRRRAVDRRIVAQAKAAGAWDKKPIGLGGRALELKAWEDYKIKREPGESDAELRRRYKALDLKEWQESKIKMEPEELATNMRRRKIPPEILYGEDKTGKQTKEESQNG